MLLPGTALAGKTLGIIGTGKIGADVAHRAIHGFSMKVVYYDIARNLDLEEKYGARFSPSVDEVLRGSDVVSLHVPLLDSTRHLIGGERLKLMKPTAFLINTARGPVIDEKALVAALKAGIIAGAGLDVFEDEPKLSPGLAKLRNVVLTPHIASATAAAREDMARMAATNVIAALSGNRPPHALS
jgi:glyoxylate reductase